MYLQTRPNIDTEMHLRPKLLQNKKDSPIWTENYVKKMHSKMKLLEV